MRDDWMVHKCKANCLASMNCIVKQCEEQRCFVVDFLLNHQNMCNHSCFHFIWIRCDNVVGRVKVAVQFIMPDSGNLFRPFNGLFCEMDWPSNVTSASSLMIEIPGHDEQVIPQVWLRKSLSKIKSMKVTEKRR